MISNISSPENDFLERLFAELNAGKIGYAVMRNHAPLPYSAGGSDLDILVSPCDADRVRPIVFNAIQAAGGVSVGVVESVGFFQVHALGRTGCTNRRWWGLRLDFYFGVYFRGYEVLDVSCEWPIRSHRGIRVLQDGFAGILGVLKEFLSNGVLAARYLPAARRAAISDWVINAALLAPMGDAALSRFLRLLLEDAPDSSLKRECQSLRREILDHARSQVGLCTWVARARYEWSKFRRYLRPSGIVLAILGVDGAGKSSVIKAILPVLNAATHNAVVVRHLRPTLLPPLARLKGKKTVSDGPVLEPHGAVPSGRIVSFFRLAYLTVDYVLGYWLWTRPRIAKQPTVVLFDRYAYDMALDPRRFRIGLSDRVTKWFAALAPKPDIIFCLHGDPAVIAARKQELSQEETRRQVEALRAFARAEPRAVLVPVDTTIEETRDQFLEVLMRHLAGKGVR